MTLPNPLNLPPEFIYQEYARKKLVLRSKSGLIAKPGSGKTRIIIATLQELNLILPDPDCVNGDRSILIMCSGPAIATWKKEIVKWLGTKYEKHTHVVRGKPKERKELWINAQTQFGIYITNYSVFIRDFHRIYGHPGKKADHWSAVVADEYHKAFRRRKSKTFGKFMQLTQFIDVVIPASGTSMGRDPSTLFTLFKIINRRVFSSYWKFVETFCNCVDTEFGKRICGPKESALPQLKAIIDKYLAYIPDAVIANQLPDGRRMTLDVEMTHEQRKHYKRLVDEMITEVGDEIIITANALDNKIKLMQLLCCPRIISENLGMGAGYEAILDTLDSQPHVMIFVPFRAACFIVAEQLRIDMQTENVFILMGQIGEDVQKERLEQFRRTKGIIVCTQAYAESFDCETCDSSFFLGYTAFVGQLEQAEGRTQRAISKHKFVTWRYIKYAGTIDEDTLLDIEQTLTNIKKVMNRPEAFIKALGGCK